MDVRAHLLVTGRVQGVFFRASTKDIAEQLGVTGWVRNTSDGKVEVLIEGEESVVKDFISWCRDGPRLAQVSDIDIEYQIYLGEFQEFNITY